MGTPHVVDIEKLAPVTNDVPAPVPAEHGVPADVDVSVDERGPEWYSGERDDWDPCITGEREMEPGDAPDPEAAPAEPTPVAPVGVVPTGPVAEAPAGIPAEAPPENPPAG